MKNDPATDQEHERHQLADRGDVDEHRGQPHAGDVDGGKKSDDRNDHSGAARASRRHRQEVTEVIREQVTERGKRREPDKPGEPTHFESDQRSERFTGVQVRAAGLLEAAAHLRKAQDDQ